MNFYSKALISFSLLLLLSGFSACRKNAEPEANQNANIAENTAEPKPVSDTVFVHDEGGIQFTAPKGWKSPNGDKDSDNVITLTSPDEQLEVTFYIPDEESQEEASQGIVEELAKYIKNAKVAQKEQESTINGLKTVSVAGSGEDVDDGDKVDWDLTIIQAKKPVFVVSIATPAQYAKNDAAYQMLIQSIKPVAAPLANKPNPSKR